MARKQGNLRVRKGASLFGPMTRADLDKLLSAGRVAPNDQVSVSEGPWMSIEHYLATTPAEVAAAQPAAPSGWKAAPTTDSPADAKPAEPQERPCLHVVHENRKYPAMTRRQVKGLLDSARLSGDDLICAIDGPWMRVADFFATRVGSAVGDVSASAAIAELPPEELVEIQEDDDYVDELEEVIDEPPAPETPPPTSPPATQHRPAPATQPVSRPPVPPVPYPAAPPGSPWALPVPRGGAPAAVPKLSDQWYVKVRGMHSMNLQKHHLKTLLAIREITPDNPVRHLHWTNEDWRPLREIPQLADLVK